MVCDYLDKIETCSLLDYMLVLCVTILSQNIYQLVPVGMNHLKKDNCGNKMAIQGLYLLPSNKEIVDVLCFSTLRTSMF